MLTLVTGASSGIGLALTKNLISQGHEVIMLARNREKLAQIANKLGKSATIACADVRDAKQLESVLKSTLAGRRLDMVIHAAGILRISEDSRSLAGDMKACAETNVDGTVNVVNVVTEHMGKTGHITLISSVSALASFPGGFEAYAQSKAAVAKYAESLREYLLSRGITITVAYPSIVDTPMIERPLPPVYGAFKHHTAEETAKAIISDSRLHRRESFITGSDRFLAGIARMFPGTFAAIIRSYVKVAC